MESDEATVEEVRKEARLSANEEKRARFVVPVQFECEMRERLEGMMQVVESELDDLVLVAKATLDTCKEWHTTKYWDLFRVMQKMVLADKIQEIFPKLDEYANETEAFDDLQNRSRRVQEFYQIDNLAAYFQSVSSVADFEQLPAEGEAAAEEPCASLPFRRHTISQISNYYENKEPISETCRRDTWCGPHNQTQKRRKSEAMPKSSLSVIDDDNKGLVIIGTGFKPETMTKSVDMLNAAPNPQIIKSPESEEQEEGLIS
ncbi:uncharacterized protein LOC135934090 [Cloeon dipterum]|uniref:uncharacterized protein LOC135934090 n=1 Tax=Cloeon dipterum TaxID=197152 RepID=UPI00321FA672